MFMKKKNRIRMQVSYSFLGLNTERECVIGRKKDTEPKE